MSMLLGGRVFRCILGRHHDLLAVRGYGVKTRQLGLVVQLRIVIKTLVSF